MAITINGNGTIDGISIGGIPNGVVDTDVLADNAVVFGKIGTTEQGQLCKAWVNFNGTGTVAIRASYNVSSITDITTGWYRINFTTSLPDANFSVVTSCVREIVSNGDIVASYATLASSYAEVRIGTAATPTADVSSISTAIFR